MVTYIARALADGGHQEVLIRLHELLVENLPVWCTEETGREAELKAELCEESSALQYRTFPFHQS